jgi:hypothetical protein
MESQLRKYLGGHKHINFRLRVHTCHLQRNSIISCLSASSYTQSSNHLRHNIRFFLVSLSNELSNSMSSLLLQDEDLESLKVRQLPSSGFLFNLLSPCRGSPFGVDARSLPFLTDSHGTSSTREFGDDMRRQNDMSKGNSLTRNASLRSVNKSLLS